MRRNQVYFRSSSFKMAMLFTGLLSAAVLSLGYFLYDFGREGYRRDSETAIDTEISSILLEMKLKQNEDLENIIGRRAGQGRGIHYLLSDLQGNWKAGDLKRYPEAADRITEGVILFELQPSEHPEEEGIQVAAKIHTLTNGDKLLVARDIDDISRRFARMRLLSALSILCMLMVILVSFLISLYVVSRINRMSDTALEIMETGDLSRRLAIDSRWDDLSHLSRVLNEMLARIEGLLEGVRQVSDNIAHDLRTPLTRLRNRLESLRDNPKAREDIDGLIEEADQILSTFNSLLRISRMDAGRERGSFTEVELGKVLQDVCELYQPIAQEEGKELTLSTATLPRVRADRDLVFQALVNVLDNAVKHAVGGDRIALALREADGEEVLLEVVDNGPGIPDRHKERVLERFFRGDASRTTRGSGLGLSMVAAIVRLHDGRLVLSDVEPQGLRVQIFLPVRPAKITKS